MYSDHYEPAESMKKNGATPRSDGEGSSSRSSGNGDWYRPIACVTREDYLRDSDSLTYNLTIVYASTASPAVNDGETSSADGDRYHQKYQADDIVNYLQIHNMSTDNVMVVEYDSHRTDNDRLLLSVLTGFNHNGSDSPEYTVLDLNSLGSSSLFSYNYHKMMRMEKISIRNTNSSICFDTQCHLLINSPLFLL